MGKRHGPEAVIVRRHLTVSNIHAGGLSYGTAAEMLVWLMTEAQHRKLAGVDLKDDRPIAITAARGAAARPSREQLPAPRRLE
jgi:hypothetical protein